MADAILMSGGVGGVASDDVTARREHVLQGYTALTSDSDDEPIQGTMVNRGTWNTASEVVNAPWENTIHTRFEEGYYPRDGNFKPTAKIPYAVLVNAIGLDNSKILDNYNILGKQGTIPRWICTTGDVITALGGEGFAWDDTHANRGRGIVVRIPNGYYIQGANWAFLPSPNHLPHNIRKGVNINGTIGTMEDYGAGRMVFRGATFDGTIATGVAKKGFVLNGINRYYDLRSDIRRCEGVNDGGIKLLNSYNGNTRQRSAEDIGCVLSDSINLTPFRWIKVGFVVFNFKGDGTASQPAQIELETGVVSTAGVGGEVAQPFSDYPVRVLGGRSKFISHVMVSTSRNAGNLSNKAQKYLTLDVSDLQGQYFLYFLLGAIQHEYSEGWVHATVLINSIQVIN